MSDTQVWAALPDHDQETDDTLTLAAILLLLASRHPDQAGIYALMAEQAAIEAQGAIEKLTRDVEKAIEAAATKANEAYHAALAAEGEAAAKAAFEADFRLKLGAVLDTFGLAGEGGGRVDLIMSQEILNAWNEANYSTMFEDMTGHWQFHTEGDAHVCPFCKRLAERIFRNDDAEAGILLPAIHFNDRCWATAVTRKVNASEVSDGSRFSYAVAEGFAYDKRGALGIAA